MVASAMEFCASSFALAVIIKASSFAFTTIFSTVTCTNESIEPVSIFQRFFTRICCCEREKRVSKQGWLEEPEHCRSLVEPAVLHISSFPQLLLPLPAASSPLFASRNHPSTHYLPILKKLKKKTFLQLTKNLMPNFMPIWSRWCNRWDDDHVSCNRQVHSNSRQYRDNSNRY